MEKENKKKVETGLLNKNGKELFEGDVIDVPNDECTYEEIVRKGLEELKKGCEELFNSKSNIELTMKFTVKGIPTITAIMEADNVKAGLTKLINETDFGYPCNKKLSVKVKPCSKKKGDIK